MSQSLRDIKSITDNTFKRNLVMWFIRWCIGFAIVGIITSRYDGFGWLWYVAIPVALFSLLFNLGVMQLLSRKISRAGDAQEALQSQLVPEDKELEAYIVGTWILDTIQAGNHVTGSTQYADDHSLVSKGSIDIHGVVVEFEVEGRWHVKGSTLCWTAETSSNTDIIPVGLSQCEQILSISHATKSYKDEEGIVWTETRDES